MRSCLLPCVRTCPRPPRLPPVSAPLSFLRVPSVSARLVCSVCCRSHLCAPHPSRRTPPHSRFSSLSLYLPHRLCISLHKARITQATPFHLLSSSSSLLPHSLFKIQSPVFSPSVCATRVCILFFTILCPALTALLLFLMHVEEFASSSATAGIRFVVVLIFSFTCQSGSREMSLSFYSHFARLSQVVC